jgi:hypothetical protein
MLENLLNLVKENSGDAIITNSAVPNEFNENAIQITTNSIFESLKGQLSSGNISQITEFFRGTSQNDSNPLLNGINANVISSLTSKLGLDSEAAKGIASALVPLVMSKLASKTNDPNDKSFDLQGIIGSLGGSNDMIGGLADVVGSSDKGSADNVINSLKGMFSN